MDTYDVITYIALFIGCGFLLWCAKHSGGGVGKPLTSIEHTEMDNLRIQLAAAEGAYGRMLTLLISDVHLSAADTIVCFLAMFGIETRRVDIPEEVLSAIGDPPRFKAALEKHFDLVIETSWRDR